MPDLLAAQITAIATAVLAFLAMVTVVFAVLAFRKQSAEETTIQRQAARDIEDRHRAQAIQVFAWADQRLFDDDPDDLRAAARVMNSSRQPIYDVGLDWILSPATASHPATRRGTRDLRGRHQRRGWFDASLGRIPGCCRQSVADPVLRVAR